MCDMHTASDQTRRSMTSYLDVLGFKLPLEVAVEGGRVDAAGDVDALCQLVDVLQGSLDTYINTQSHD